MKSGNRVSLIVALALSGAFAAADAGRVREDGTGAMWVAPELLEALNSPALPGCMGVLAIEPVGFAANGRVAFEWHPDTGELSFTADGVKPPATLPEAFSPELLAAAMQSCE